MKLCPTSIMERFNDGYRIEVVRISDQSLETYYETVNLTLATEAYSRLSREFGNRFIITVYLTSITDLTAVFSS